MGQVSCCESTGLCCRVGGGADVTMGLVDEAMPVLGEAFGDHQGFVQAVRSTGHYRVRLSKLEHGRLGIDVEHSEDTAALPVVAITGGAAEAWNRTNPMRPLRPGDAVIEVNGCRGDVQRMLDICQQEPVLELTLAREAVPMHGGPGSQAIYASRPADDVCACVKGDERHPPCSCAMW